MRKEDTLRGMLTLKKGGGLKFDHSIIRTANPEAQRFGAGNATEFKESFVPFQKLLFGFGQALGLERSAHFAHMAIVKVISDIFVLIVHLLASFQKNIFTVADFGYFVKDWRMDGKNGTKEKPAIGMAGFARGGKSQKIEL